MLPILPPFFAHSRQAFEAQFSGDGATLVFRESGIGPAVSITRDEREQLLAVHDRYATIYRWNFRTFLLLALVLLPLARILNNLDIVIAAGSSVPRSLFLLPLVFMPATSLWARSQLRRRLAAMPVTAAALPRHQADGVLLAAASWTSLVLPPAVLALTLYAYKPSPGGWPVMWTLGLVVFSGYFLLLAWEKYRRQTTAAELRAE